MGLKVTSVMLSFTASVISMAASIIRRPAVSYTKTTYISAQDGLILQTNSGVSLINVRVDLVSSSGLNLSTNDGNGLIL